MFQSIGDQWASGSTVANNGLNLHIIIDMDLKLIFTTVILHEYIFIYLWAFYLWCGVYSKRIRVRKIMHGVIKNENNSYCYNSSIIVIFFNYWYFMGISNKMSCTICHKTISCYLTYYRGSTSLLLQWVNAHLFKIIKVKTYICKQRFLLTRSINFYNWNCCSFL